MLFLARTPMYASSMFNARVEVKREREGDVHPEEVMCGPKPAASVSPWGLLEM